MKSMLDISKTIIENRVKIGDTYALNADTVKTLVAEAYAAGYEKGRSDMTACEHTWHNVYKDNNKEGRRCMECNAEEWDND